MMKDKKINTNKLKISKFVYIIVFFLFVIFGVSLTYRCLVDYKATDKLTISEFTKAAEIYETDHAGIYEMCKVESSSFKTIQHRLLFYGS